MDEVQAFLSLPLTLFTTLLQNTPRTQASASVAMDPDRDIVQLTQQCLEYLNDMLRDIEAFGQHVYILADEHLAALNVQKAEPLDIDETAIDFGARFYSPRVPVEQARQTTDSVLADRQDHVSRQDWRKRCRRGSFPLIFEDDETWGPEERHPLCTPQQCAASRLHWCLAAGGASNYNHSYFDSCGFGVWEGSGWYYVRFVEPLSSLAPSAPC